MNYVIILAGGVGQRMHNTGMPKQFLSIFQKPIIIYTLEKFDNCKEIDGIVVVCNSAWIDYMNELIVKFSIKKVIEVVAGGKDRQGSLKNGISILEKNNINDEDLVLIHDAVRPLVQPNIIIENIRIANKYGNAITVHPVIESVVVSDNDIAKFEDFKKRDDTYSLTAPQTFKMKVLNEIYLNKKEINSEIPILDSALLYSYFGNDIHLVKESNKNIKVTTPEDYYILKAMLELEENKFVLGV